MHSLVSIVIPLYNREELVKETLDSVQAQTYPHWECIIVDDVSTDNSLATAQEYACRDNRFKVYQRHREPKGAPTCRNIGLEKAEGEYVIFLDSDDLLADFCLERRVEKVKENGDCDFLVFQSSYSIEGRVLDIPITKTSENYLFSFLMHDIPWCISSVCWKKKILIVLGGFNELFPRLQDPEIHTRALMIAGIKFCVFSKSEADSIYRISYKRQKLLPGLKGFRMYMEEVFPPFSKNYDLVSLGSTFRPLIVHAEKFMVKNFERRHTFESFRLIKKIQRLALGFGITDSSYNKRFYKRLFWFYTKFLFNLKESQDKFLGQY